MKDVDSIMKIIDEQKLERVSFCFVDILGKERGVWTFTEPEDQMRSYLEDGVDFDGSSIKGGAPVNKSDLVLKPDLDSFVVTPWSEGKEGLVFCYIMNPDGTNFPGCSRQALKRQEDLYMRELGVKFMAGPELEFFIIHPFGNGSATDGYMKAIETQGYFEYNPLTDSELVLSQIAYYLKSLGLSLEQVHREVAKGQFEIDFRYGPGMETADKFVLYKMAARAAAKRHGYDVTFMPKPFEGVNGSGCHIHQSLQTTDGKNMMFDSSGQYYLSDMAKYFVAGQLKYAKEMSAVFAPTMNSYLRLVPGYEAPNRIAWGPSNRSDLIRIPGYRPGNEKATRAEFRGVDPTCNPYLTMAALMAAGMEGIRQKLEPPQPREEDVYHLSQDQERLIEELPGSLEEAIALCNKSELVKMALGETLHKGLIEHQKEEIESSTGRADDKWLYDQNKYHHR
ncbi:MAG: glutamine synthetase [Kosmotogaceae bacterium]|nr:glutamine synthetase [Kosmotogaceae bacterium]